MQEHNYSVVVDGPPDEVWGVFWTRQDVPERNGVGIRILNPGDDVGEGLVRTCKFRVPRWLLSRGVGRSWELLKDVKPTESWRYDAIGKPLWSRAEGFTRLEDAGGGRTRIHFRETYHAFNPLMRLLFERRVHRYLSRDNDRLITQAVNAGLARRRRAAEEAGGGSAPSASSQAAGAPGAHHLSQAASEDGSTGP